jgi:hypothetical protein
MTLSLRRAFILSALGAAVALGACDENSDVISPAAPREPNTAVAPAPTATPTPTPTVSATPAVGESVGFLGRIREIRGPYRMTIGNVEEVVTSASTEFVRNGAPAAFTDFAVGENVRVAGVVLGDGAILASRITLLP